MDGDEDHAGHVGHDEYDEDDDEFGMVMVYGIWRNFRAMMLCGFIYILTFIKNERAPPLFAQRLNWEEFVHIHGHRRDFKRHMRMSLHSFNKLLAYLRKDLECDEEMAGRRGGAILPELQLYCCIRWLAGGSYTDLYFFTGISCASFYRVVWKTIFAINTCEHLAFNFPKTRDECARAAAEFKNISFLGVLDNVVAVVDGFLLKIVTPSKKEAGNVRSYFSGHYQHHGVNVQAACDPFCRFVFISVAGPGVMGDRDALNESGLYDIIEKLPELFCTIGDCAYKATEHMLPIFSGINRLSPKYDTFNFYASQVRIRIEMAFGLMTKKWGILGRAVSIGLGNIKYMVLAIARLHNFCINERLKEMGSLHVARHEWQRSIFEESLRAEAAELEADLDAFNGWSLNRERIVDKIQRLRLARPENGRGRGTINGCVVQDENSEIVEM